MFSHKTGTWLQILEMENILFHSAIIYKVYMKKHLHPVGSQCRWGDVCIFSELHID